MRYNKTKSSKVEEAHKTLYARAVKADEMTKSWASFMVESFENTQKLYGLTQSEFIRLLGISKSTYHNLSKATSDPLGWSGKAYLLLMRFCYIFGLDLQMITKPAEIYGNDEILELGAWIGSLPHPDLQAIVEAVNESGKVDDKSKEKFTAAVKAYIEPKE